VRRACAALFVLLAITPAIGSEKMPTIQEVKARHESRILALPGVVSVGVGRNPDGQPCIVVGFASPRPQTEEKIPAVLEGYPVRIEIIGPLEAR